MKNLAPMDNIPSPSPRRSQTPPDVILVWLARLTSLVANPPTRERFDEQSQTILEVCADLPPEVWTKETRLGWLKQPREHDGRLPGKFWPTIAELYAYLRAIAQNLPAECSMPEWEGDCRKAYHAHVLSLCNGAGRAMSREAFTEQWKKERGIEE